MFIGIIAGLVVLLLIFSRTIVNKTHQSSALAHFSQAQEITEDVYMNIEPGNMSFLQYPGHPTKLSWVDFPQLVDILLEKGVIKATESSKESDKKHYYIVDSRFNNIDTNTYIDSTNMKIYFISEPGYKKHNLIISEFDFENNRIKKEEVIPWNHKNFKVKERLACFSCGCKCYVYFNKYIVNDLLYVNVSGKEFAINKNRQGIYFYDRDVSEWKKLTPQVQGLKVHSNGCEVAYSVDGKFYNLKTCEL